MTYEHAVTVYLSDPLWQILQTQARQDWRETVSDVIVTTLTRALLDAPTPVSTNRASKPRPGRQRSHPEFGLLLRQARARYGWSRAALGRYAQLDAAHISRLEYAKRAPSAHAVGLLARALQLNADETAAFYRAAGFIWEAIACAG